MYIRLNQNFCELIANNIFIENNDFYTIEDLYDDDKYTFREILFQRDEPLFDIFNNVQNRIKKNCNINISDKPNNKKEKKEEIYPGYISLTKIKDFIKNKLPIDIKDELNQSIFLDKNIKYVEDNIEDRKLLGKKRKKKDKDKEIFIDDKKNSLGRKEKNDSSIRKHNKYSGDNIIKKIKFKFLEAFLKFVNDVINNTLEKTKLIKYNQILRENLKKEDKLEDLLKMIIYINNVDRLNKKTDLELLQMKFKELFSQNISKRYIKLDSQSNTKIIKKLLEEEKENSNINFVLNMKFKDWIDVFTYKKELKSVENFEEEKNGILMNYFEFSDTLISKIYRTNKDDENYILYFLIYLFNYERWFLLKRGRNRTITKIKNEHT